MLYTVFKKRSKLQKKKEDFCIRKEGFNYNIHIPNKNSNKYIRDTSKSEIC